MGRPPGEPTTIVSVRVPNDVLERIDADAQRQGKATRSAWLLALAVAVLDHKLVPVDPAPIRSTGRAVSDTRDVRSYSKESQTKRRPK
jgi:hypothetical protein